MIFTLPYNVCCLVNYYNYPVPDFSVPSIDLLLDIAKVIQYSISPEAPTGTSNTKPTSGRIAVHCHAGYGRTGVAIAGYLAFNSNKTAIQIIDFMRRKRFLLSLLWQIPLENLTFLIRLPVVPGQPRA